MDIARMAQKLTREAYSPMRKKDTDSRNTSWYDMVTTYAPNLSKNCKNFVANKYDVKASEIKIEQTHYLMYRDESNNNNKFHYYVLFSLPQGNYVSVNCSGRIGFIERTFDLTKKMFPNEMCNEYQALKAMNNHMKSKLNKGYNPIRLRSGSVDKVASKPGKYKNFTGEINFENNKGSVKNATFQLKNHSIFWEQGIWLGGEWYNGVWKFGVWKNGVWHFGVWKNGAWNDGVWEEGLWQNGAWKDGVWEDGSWIKGTWGDGTWLKGRWIGGRWFDGKWVGGTWKDGEWRRGKDKKGNIHEQGDSPNKWR